MSNIIGHNFRLGEIEAAIAREQLKKLSDLINSRQQAAKRLRMGLKSLNGIRLPLISEGCTHVYYVFGIVLTDKSLYERREKIAHALKSEGVPALGIGYQNIHLNPIFRQRIAYGTKSFPWKGLTKGDSIVSYTDGICPKAERLHKKTFLGIGLCHHLYTNKEVDLIIDCFHKVWEGLNL